MDSSSSPLRDPNSLYYQRNDVRRLIIISYWAVIILALPLWWHTTSIQRLSLPSARIQQTPDSLQLPVPICLEEADPILSNRLGRALLQRVSQIPEKWSNLLPQLSQESICEDATYVVKFKDGPAVIDGRTVNLPPNVAQQPETFADILTSLITPSSSVDGPINRITQYSPRYRLAFTLLNEDASQGSAITEWGTQQALSVHINPLLDQLRELHNFTIESQVQFHAPLAFTPLKLEEGYGVAPDDLTVFVNSEQWSLSSGSSNDPVLHFLLFLPSPEHRPLRILNNDGTPAASNAFLLPQWGGIFIHNPTESDTDNQPLPVNDLHKAFSSFSKLLRILLGAPSLPDSVQYIPPNTQLALSLWQVDALLRQRTLENAKSSRDTLLSLVKLVDQIGNMPVREDVQEDVQNALEALLQVHEQSSVDLHEAFNHSAQAHTLSSRAFFNPGMLALLYFPAEHKYAVYAPLFASAMIPLAVAGLKEFSAWWRERRASLQAI